MSNVHRYVRISKLVYFFQTSTDNSKRYVRTQVKLFMFLSVCNKIFTGHTYLSTFLQNKESGKKYNHRIRSGTHVKFMEILSDQIILQRNYYSTSFFQPINWWWPMDFKDLRTYIPILVLIKNYFKHCSFDLHRDVFVNISPKQGESNKIHTSNS